MNEFRDKHPAGQQDARTENLVSFWSSIVDAETEVANTPDNANALSGLGVLYYYAGTYAKAIEPTERAQQLDPEILATYEILGPAYFYTGRIEDAVHQFDVLTEKGEPEDVRVLSTAGTACLMIEQYDKAVRYFARYAESAPDDASAHSNLADALYRAGRPAETARECHKAIELDPNGASAYYFLGRVHRDQNENEEAVKAFERFLELAPESPLAEEVQATIAEIRRG